MIAGQGLLCGRDEEGFTGRLRDPVHVHFYRQTSNENWQVQRSGRIIFRRNAP